MKARADEAGPNDDFIDASPLVDNILALLEEAGAPETLTDAVVKLVQAWEFSREPDPIECPACMGYGYFDEDENPSNDRRGRKCLDCSGTGNRLVPEAKGNP